MFRLSLKMSIKWDVAVPNLVQELLLNSALFFFSFFSLFACTWEMIITNLLLFAMNYWKSRMNYARKLCYPFLRITKNFKFYRIQKPTIIIFYFSPCVVLISYHFLCLGAILSLFIYFSWICFIESLTLIYNICCELDMTGAMSHYCDSSDAILMPLNVKI